MNTIVHKVQDLLHREKAPGSTYIILYVRPDANTIHVATNLSDRADTALLLNRAYESLIEFSYQTRH
jgi:hypothetical protein